MPIPLLYWQAMTIPLPQLSSTNLSTSHSQLAFGYSMHGFVCDLGGRVQLVYSQDYVFTVSTTAHELGHSLGAEHDGEGEAAACKAEDKFIMSPSTSHFQLNKNYSRNPWIFSNCSVESFIKTLANKTCLFTKNVYSDEQMKEWKVFMEKLPGELYSPNEQCQIIYGPGSFYCGKNFLKS
ncbi:hypothetical protein CHS0354_003886 [Potamilus streckersoni]|uniref:Peptidase M12B domain-containing protein n=1 Tax=Potamilus streckersoni TaxID=2493646 RepID=A0AAE0VR73_9BIVA|nr:hypothetical protein CHS0354_003886 [Potamilus streckersoni]